MPSPLFVLGRFPPPLDGQAVATQRLADLLDGPFGVRRVRLTAPEGALARAQARFRLDRVRYYVGARRRLRAELRQAPGAPVLWASVSPSLLGHLRDLLTVVPALAPAQPVFGVVHWGNFERVFTAPLTSYTARRMVGRMQGYVFLDDGLAERCAPWIPPEKRFVIPNTIDDALILSPEEIKAKRSERKGRRELRLLFLSNMIPAKGYRDVAEAVRILHARGVPVRADFAGRWESEADRVAFERFVGEAGLSRVLTHHGGVHDRAAVRALYSRADVFLLPTYYATEAQPMTVIEAMSAGTPVVVTPHAGLPQMVPEGKAGLFVPPRAPEAIAEAVEALADVERWQGLSAGARARFESTFSPAAVRQRWEQLLAQALAVSPQPV